MSRVEIKGVSKSYGAVRAVEGVDLVMPAGSRTAIVGPSGSGKTTLLRLIAGFEEPDAGSILLGGQIVADKSGAVPAHLRRIGYLPQDGGLFPHLTVAGNIGFGLKGRAAQKSERIAELLTMVALDPSLGARWPHQLSGGQQQRVALARALAQHPWLILLDEPFSALDTGLRTATRKAVTQLLEQLGATTILVTHDQDEAFSFADQIAVIRDGQMVQVGAGADLYARPRDETTALFLGEAIVLPAHIAKGVADCVVGQIPVDDALYEGAARIMLRPDQLRIEEVETGGREPARWQVAEVEFGGSSSLVTVRSLETTQVGSSDFLTLRSPSIGVPSVGSWIRIVAIGQAHKLPFEQNGP